MKQNKLDLAPGKTISTIEHNETIDRVETYELGKATEIESRQSYPSIYFTDGTILIWNPYLNT